MNKVNFTLASLEKLAPPPAGGKVDRLYTYDAKTPGLVFCITANSRRSFYLYRRIDGVPKRTRLGSFPEITIEQARKLAAGVCGKIANGIDPQAEKRQARSDTSTLNGLFTHYLETHAKVHKKTWEDDEAQFNRYFGKAVTDKLPDDKPAPFPGWRYRRLSTIRKPDVAALHIRIGTEHGHYAANRFLALLHAMFEKAPDIGWNDANPAHGITRYQEKERERFLQADELPRFFAAVEKEENETIRDFVLVSLLTGARRANVQSMRWDELTLPPPASEQNNQRKPVQGTWRIPETKNGQMLTVALAPAVVKILNDRRDNNSEWVFPSHGKTGHLTEPKTTWARILKRAKITNLRMHDLRRTLGSWQAAGGSSLPIIGKSLGHKSVVTTAIYARLHLDPVRASVESAALAIIEAGKEEANA